MAYSDFIIKNKSLTERVIIGNVFIEPFNTVYIRVDSSNISNFKKELNKYSKILEVRTTNFTDISKCITYDNNGDIKEKYSIDGEVIPNNTDNSENKEDIQYKEESKNKKEKTKNK